jgi:uncharacterized protein
MDGEAHRALVEAFRARREARFRAPTGWLSLVDRIPVTEGDTALPFGTLRVEPGQPLRLRVAEGAEVTFAGQRVTGAVELAADDGSRPPEVFEHGGRRYELARSAGGLSVRVRDPSAAALRQFPGIPVFAIDSRWRIAGRFEALTEAAVELVPRTDGVDVPTPRVGTVRLELGGASHALAVYFEESSGRWFIPFVDATSGAETYGAGRSVFVDRPDPGEPLVVDFNLAFNLPCAFNWLVACPIPPAHNRLPVAIRAGEKAPTSTAPADPP